MIKKQNKFKRKNFFINKQFQSMFIIRFAIMVFFATLLLGCFLFFTSFASTTIVFKNLRVTTVPTYEYLLPSLTAGLVLSLLLTSFLSIIVGLLYSHKIAGPMFRFEQVFKQLQTGNLQQTVRLRLNDEWQQPALLLDDAISSIRKHIENIDTSVKEIESQVDLNNPDIVAKLDKIHKEIEHFTFK